MLLKKCYTEKQKLMLCILFIFSFLVSGCQVIVGEPDHIEFSPKGEQLVVSGQSLTYSACVISTTGNRMTDKEITYSCPKAAGTFKGNTFITGSEPGVYTIKATGEGFKAETTVKILPEDHMFQPFEYLGKTYLGKTSEGEGEIINSEGDGYRIDEPKTTKFDCDGFFTLSGWREESPSQIIRLDFKKLDETGKEDLFKGEDYNYFVRGDFCTRVWLRNGPGKYIIRMYKSVNESNQLIEGVESPDGQIYYGDYNSFSWNKLIAILEVNNTRDEDGTFIYPSNFIQSDDLELMNVVTDATYGLTNPMDKAVVLNKLVVDRITYDTDSLNENCRKVQDAVSTYKYKIGVCVGFTDLTAAFYRICGFPTKSISGAMSIDDYNKTGIGHAWINVSLDDGKTWKKMEPQGTNSFVDIPYDDSEMYKAFSEDNRTVNSDNDGFYSVVMNY